MNFPKIEEKILKFWKKNKIFEKSLKKRKNKKSFIFYDGPPFATGKPHYGHILATTIKDVVLRYWTMQGYYTPRRVGWDCHGLPVENLIEKELNIKTKKEILDYGIDKFNSACRTSVFRCVKDFEQTLKRIGRWADYKNAYATLNNNYIESVWWVFKQLWDRKLVYKDYRVCPYCPRCSTPLANFEVNQGYKNIDDYSIFLKFKIKSPKFPNTFFLVMTTTPWTLPGNMALAIHPKYNYVQININDENYILVEERLNVLMKNEKYNIVKKIKGEDLIGLKYEPLFDYLINLKIKNIENAFQVLPAKFVSKDEGTGIVHIAPMYGEDDFLLGKNFNLPFYHTINENGCFKKEIQKFSDQFVKKADQEIIKDLEDRSILYKKETITHSYPFCWRCDTPLLYYALDSWYIAVTKIKKQLILNNKKIHWVPSHIKYGRFGKWLEEVRDWVFSRNRFWGAPLPIWHCSTEKCNNFKIIDSIKELKKLSGEKIKDLHKPYIDKITFKCEKCKQIKSMRRVDEVFDCWFESGAMPYAQWHYPFENKKLLENSFPADFIAEGLDQTRGWFYTLHIIATILTLTDKGLGKNKPAFLNVIVNGLILDSKGKKLSKKLKNYPEPEEIFNKYGADSLRYFLITSTPIGEDYRFSEKGVEQIWRKIISTLWNIYSFFEIYQDKLKISNFIFQTKKLKILDRWLLSLLNKLILETKKYMEQYELTKAYRLFDEFIDDLSNWYLRRSRERFQKPRHPNEKQEATKILYYTLLNVVKLMAPITPFISEEIYQLIKPKSKITLPLSVHLCDYPKPNKKLINKNLMMQMKKIREIIALALAQRVEAKIKVRQPLNKLKIKEDKELKNKKELLDLIKEEINVKEIIFDKKIKQKVKLDTEITPELREEGIIREIIRYIQDMRKKANLKPGNKISIAYFSNNCDLNKILEKNIKYILQNTYSKSFFQTQHCISNKQNFDLIEKKQIDQQTIWFGLKKI